MHLHLQRHRHLQRHMSDSWGFSLLSASASVELRALPRRAIPITAPDHLPRLFRKSLLASSGASSVTGFEQDSVSLSGGTLLSLSSKSRDIDFPPLYSTI
jgi:hypothetical protein